MDCNSAYTLDALPMFEKLDRFGLAMIEQPLAHDDLVDHAELQRRMATPVCLDESITSAAKARKAIQLGACRWVNIKPGRDSRESWRCRHQAAPVTRPSGRARGLR